MKTVDTAVLLVAGVGSRLRPLTDHLPKALVPIGDVSILARAITALQSVGVRRFVLATGFEAEKVMSLCASLGVDAVACPNPVFDSTQNAVSLAYCAEQLRGRAFFKLDGDVVFEPEVLTRLLASDAPLAVAVDRSRALDEEAMKVRADQHGTITVFGKGIPCAESAGESIGIERLDASASITLFAALEEMQKQGRTERYYEDVYSDCLALGSLTAQVVEVGDLAWTEIDNYDDLAVARSLFGVG